MKSSSHSAIPSLQGPATSSPEFPVAPLLLREFAGSKGTDRSFGGDVEEEVVVLQLPNEVLGFAEGLLLVVGQTWLTYTRPLTSLTVLFAMLTKGQHGRSILEKLHSDENTKILHINLRFFTRLDLSIGCYHCYGSSGSLESIQLFRARVLLFFAWKLQSRLRSVTLLVFSKRLPAVPKLRQESRTYLGTPFF